VALRSAQDSFVDREEFLRECRLLATLQHPNLARLIGVSTTEEPYCVILEHSQLGDLYQYLRQQDTSKDILPYSRLLEMSSQIAAGMKYLESRTIIHKDLAARLTKTNSV
jgi:serine/threonine protein kinase